MLDPRQQEACNHFTGPCLTLAGPGSGKTTVLVHRIISLIKDRHVLPRDILVITFTKDAALEMQKRFISMYSDMGYKDGNTVVFGTFHSVFYHILKNSDQYKNSSLLSEKDKMRLFLDAACECGLKSPDAQLLQQLSKEVSFLMNTEQGAGLINENKSSDEIFNMNENISSSEICNQNEYIKKPEFSSVVYSKTDFAAFYHAYDRMKRRNGYIDFDDMLVRCMELLQTDAKARNYWQSRFSQILVDEAQDMNQVQFQVLKILAGKHQNVFIVGDDDQSIYGFRGADPAILKEFQKSYQNTHVVYLSVNYRSSSSVVLKASAMITHNKNRFAKEIRPFQTDPGRVVVKECSDVEKEAQEIASACRRYLERSTGGKVAILFRKRKESQNVVRALTRLHVPYYMREQITTIFEHWITKDILSYVKAAAGVAKPEDFLLIANRPNRYIRRESLDMEEFSWEKWIAYYDDRGWMRDRIWKLKRELEAVGKMSAFAAVNYIRKAIGYEAYIRENGMKFGITEDEGLLILNEIQQMTKEEHGSGRYHLRNWLSKMEEGRQESEKARTPASTRGVGLYTFHGSKGLEFDRVYILDVNETVTPANKNDDEAQTEEERRMFYVACTRAKKELYLYHVQQLRGKKVAPSRFIGEMEGEDEIY